MKMFHRRQGLRAAIRTSFTLGALLLAVLLALGTWTVTSQIMLRQRLSLSERQARNSAVEYLFQRARGVAPVEALHASAVDNVADGVLVGSTWTIAPAGFPAASLTHPELQGSPSSTWTTTPSGARATLVRVDLPNGRGVLYELTETTELNAALGTLAGVLLAAAAAAVGAGLIMGSMVAQRVLKPLSEIGDTAQRIRGGDLSRRIPPTSDPDLNPITGSFNQMIATLERRIQRDSRFAADVSHELRSPLTTLIASVDLLRRRRETLDRRAQVTLDLMSRELARLRSVLEDLIELGRLESDEAWVPERIDVTDLARHVLVGHNHDVSRLEAPDESIAVLTDRRGLETALANLVRNADLHGAGLKSVQVTADQGEGVIRVVDAGPGVDRQDRERIFGRFVRGGVRGDLPGSGLGLSIVAESMNRAGGSVRYLETPGGGATFELRIPTSTPSEVTVGGPQPSPEPRKSSPRGPRSHGRAG